MPFHCHAGECHAPVERVAKTTAIEIELGPTTRETLHHAEEGRGRGNREVKLGRLVGK